MDKAKWLWAVLAAGFLGFLGWLVYGKAKQLPSVLEARLRANRAEKRKLQTELASANLGQQGAAAEAVAAKATREANDARARIKRLDTRAADITGSLRAVRGDPDAYVDRFNTVHGAAPGRSASNG